MAQLDDAINGLSSDELDTLNSDPNLLSDFKAKYSGNVFNLPSLPSLAPSTDSGQLVPNALKDAVGQGIGAVQGAQALSGDISSLIPPASALLSPIKTLKGMGNDALEAVKQPIDTAYKYPVSTALAVGSAGANSLSSVGDFIEERLPKFYNFLAKVPTEATKTLVKNRGNILTDVSPESISESAQKVQQILQDTKEQLGLDLNSAKSKLGIPVTVAEKEKALLKTGTTHGISPDDLPEEFRDSISPNQSPEELAASVAKFKALKPVPDPMSARVASVLQDAINKKVDWSSSQGGDINGVLKQQYKDLASHITEASPELAKAKSSFSDIASVFDDLESKMGDMDKPGQAENFLRNLFTKDTPQNQDYRDRLGKLENLSGKPVLTDLWNKLTGEEFDKWIGYKGGAHIASVVGLGSLAAGKPLEAAGAATYLTAQAPKLLSMGAKAAYGAANLSRALGFTPAMINAANGPVLQSLLDRTKYRDSKYAAPN